MPKTKKEKKANNVETKIPIGNEITRNGEVLELLERVGAAKLALEAK